MQKIQKAVILPCIDTDALRFQVQFHSKEDCKNCSFLILLLFYPMIN